MLLRVVRGWTRSDLAIRSGISRRQLFNIEHGIHTPRLRTAVAISSDLGVRDPTVLFPARAASPEDTEDDEGAAT